MAAKKLYSFLTLSFIGILCISLLKVQLVRAEEGTPTEPPAPTEVVTEPAGEANPAPVTEEPVLEEATVIPVAEPSEEIPSPEAMAAEEESAVSISVEGLENTELVVLDEQGQTLVLGSQEALNTLGNSDPVWCPENVSAPTPGANGCSESFSSIAEILAVMQADPQSFSQNGTIFLQETSGSAITSPFVLDESSESLGPSFSALSIFNWSIQGGWNPATGSTSGETLFSGPSAYIQVGSLSNPWLGSLAINNVSVSGASQDAIQIFASNVALTNVSTTYSGANGISIIASDPGTVALNNVNASHNGHLEGSEHVGSGVYIAGASTLLEVAGGTFVDNTRYGIEAMNSISASLLQANVWTDQEDYAPGSVVTISGNSNSLNENNTGFLFGEAVHVVVQGPNGYTATCEATANSFGGWSCQITLWANELAIGDYSYMAVGLTSGVSESGIFSDSQPETIALAQPSITISQGENAVYTVNITMGGNNNLCTVTLNVTGLPAGASASFSGGNVMTTNTSFSKTLSIATTNGTPAGQYSFTVEATKGINCQGNTKALTTSGQLIVTAATTTSTSTNTPTNTAVPPTNTSTNTPTSTAVPQTSTPTSTSTNTGVPPTNTATNTPTATQMAASTATNTPTPSSTVTTSQTATPTATNSGAQAPRPRQSPTSSAIVIPLTGGDLLKLDCNSVLWMLGVKLTFYNLCDHQTTIHSVGASELPFKLPDGYSYVKGLEVDILTNGQILKELPANSGIEMDFPLNRQSRDQLAVLYWSDPDGDGKGQWIELTEQMNASKISELLGITTGEELYQLIHNASTAFYPILSTEKTGIFILVKK